MAGKRKRESDGDGHRRRMPKLRRTRTIGLPGHSDNMYPPKMTVTLSYATAVVFNPAAGGVSLNVFSANGLFDPDITGAGSQPRGFDQWMALYNHYCVLASRCKILTPSQAAPDNIFCITLAPGTTAIGSALEDIAEVPFTTVENAPGKFFGGHWIKTPWYSMRRQFRVKDIVAKDSLSGDDSANPVDQQYYHVNACSMGAGDPPSITALVVLEFNTVFYEPKIPAPS